MCVPLCVCVMLYGMCFDCAYLVRAVCQSPVCVCVVGGLWCAVVWLIVCVLVCVMVCA